MKGSFFVLAAIVIALVCAVLYRPSWEYLVIGPSDAMLGEELNNYGANGWEIVSARRAIADKTGLYEIILRRQMRPFSTSVRDAALAQYASQQAANLARAQAQAVVSAPTSSTPAVLTSDKIITTALIYPPVDDPRATGMRRGCKEGVAYELQPDNTWKLLITDGMRTGCKSQ